MENKLYIKEGIVKKLIAQYDNEEISLGKLTEIISENCANNLLADSLPLSELKDLLCEVSQLIAGWNATEAEWSKWDEEVKQKVYQLQLKIDDKKAVNFC